MRDAADEDDLFASLGGSLMRDLLADLQGDDDDDDPNGGGSTAGWLNLEQLEQELNSMNTNNNSTTYPNANNNFNYTTTSSYSNTNYIYTTTVMSTSGLCCI